ncbi:hypothetical protein NLU13_2070 [Sarocladium strictum]|uniref:Uncharacterized protein n=1 Tax=Sarocladium strictum TaxID=5046 RepID=A0AA39GS48_SARSR|nr:hypothetical protein NLU13_2070 [Sarocladium strictum]
MASVSATPVEGGSPPAPSTAPPPPAPTIASASTTNAIPRLPSEPRSVASNTEHRASLPPSQSPAMSQPPSMADRGPTPGSGTQPPKANGEIKAVLSTDEYLELSSVITKSKPEVVRQVVRDYWQRCLTGSDFHIGFILNTTLHHAKPHLLDQAVQDFGAKLASSTKHKWVQHLNTNDVDELADALFQRASDRFLDRALARRFETISGRALVNALARAERLGYDTRDIVEEKDSTKGEHVIPSMHPSTPSAYVQRASSSTQQHPQQPYASEYSDPYQPAAQPLYHAPPPPPPQYPVTHPTAAQLDEVKPFGIVFCDTCGRPCSGPIAVDNHLRKRACSNHVTKLERLGSDTCLHCGVSFSSNGGLLYHMKSDVCGVYPNSVHIKMMELLSDRAKIPFVRARQAVHSTPSSTPTTANYVLPTQSRASPARLGPAEVYASLTPQQQASFDAEMKAAEDMYGGQMREAMALPPVQAEVELAKIRNRLNSRQSNLRKKYGIKLRDRRTRAQIEEDNARIAANSPLPSSSQGVKRPLSTHADSPRKRVPLSEMGGLSGAAASAEMTDPTLNLTPAQPQTQKPSAQAAQATQAAQASTWVPAQASTTQDDVIMIDSDRSVTGTDSTRPSPSAERTTTADASRPASVSAA